MAVSAWLYLFVFEMFLLPACGCVFGQDGGWALPAAARARRSAAAAAAAGDGALGQRLSAFPFAARPLPGGMSGKHEKNQNRGVVFEGPCLFFGGGVFEGPVFRALIPLGRLGQAQSLARSGNWSSGGLGFVVRRNVFSGYKEQLKASSEAFARYRAHCIVLGVCCPSLILTVMNHLHESLNWSHSTRFPTNGESRIMSSYPMGKHNSALRTTASYIRGKDHLVYWVDSLVPLHAFLSGGACGQRIGKLAPEVRQEASWQHSVSSIMSLTSFESSNAAHCYVSKGSALSWCT